MSRRSLTLLIAGVATLVAIAVSVFVSVPYVVLMPGPTLNTLGKDSSGKPLITISGHQTFPTTGNLNMVTVSYQGAPPPNTGVNIFQALRAWLDPNEAVVPATEIFPPGQTAPLYMSYKSTGCTKPSVHLLTIDVLKPGSGA